MHPVLIVVGCMLIGAAAQKLWPIKLDMPTVFNVVGDLLTIGGGLLCLLAWREMNKAGTNIDPYQSSSVLVSSGVFAFSRNPIYLGFCLVTAGIGISKDSLFVLISVVLMVVILQWAVIEKEEAYLADLFGEEYIRYKKKVRRWL